MSTPFLWEPSKTGTICQTISQWFLQAGRYGRETKRSQRSVRHGETTARSFTDEINVNKFEKRLKKVDENLLT